MPYTLPAWQDAPSPATPISSANLTQANTAIQGLDSRLGMVETGKLPTGLVNAKGKLISSDNTATPTALLVGTDGQVLTADSTQTLGLRWSTPSGGGAVSSVAGRTGAVTLTSADVGLSNVSNSLAVPQSLVTVKGDLIVATGTATAVRLGVGADTQVLTADSIQATGLKWAAPAGGGGAVTSVAGRTGAVTLTNSDVGLGNVQNVDAIPKSLLSVKGQLVTSNGTVVGALTVSGTNNNVLTEDSTAGTGLSWKPPPVISVAGKTGTVSLAKADVGLANVDNTSDVNKPVSTAQATADALAVQKAAYTNVGDLYTKGVATGRFGVSGNNGSVLTEDSTQAAGIKWAVPATAGAFKPVDHGIVSWSFDPILAQSSSSPVNGTLYLTKLLLPAGTTILSNIYFYLVTAFSGIVAGQNQLCIYDSPGTQLNSIDLASTINTTGAKTIALSPAVNMTAGTNFVWVSFLFNATSAGTLMRASTTGALSNIGLTAANYRNATNGTGQTSSTSFLTTASNAQSPIAWWVAVS